MARLKSAAESAAWRRARVHQLVARHLPRGSRRRRAALRRGHVSLGLRRPPPGRRRAPGPVRRSPLRRARHRRLGFVLLRHGDARALPTELGPNPDKRRVRFLNPRRLGLPELPPDQLTRTGTAVPSWRAPRIGDEGGARVRLQPGPVLLRRKDRQPVPRCHDVLRVAVARSRAVEHRLQNLGAALNALLRRNGYDQSPQLEGRTTSKTRPAVPGRRQRSGSALSFVGTRQRSVESTRERWTSWSCWARS